MIYEEFIITIAKEFKDVEDIVVALLSQTSFESFVTEGNMVKAYIPQKDIDENAISEIIKQIEEDFNIVLKRTLIPDENWNKEWEKDFDPIFINENCVIHLPSHKINPLPEYDILIQPDMAFGTGHHATTFLIASLLFEEKIYNKTICDAGCGSGVLSILSSKLGAKEIFAYDIDEWSYKSSKKNIKLNKIKNIKLALGDKRQIKNKKFDVFIANINRNILLEDVEAFSETLERKGILIVSGFYDEDLSLIEKNFEKYNLKLSKVKVKNHWLTAVFKKQ
jgi:ribosomal protein L11 methyltransferase